MSVLIKGMKMPKSCKECQVSFGYGNDEYCPFLFEPCDTVEDELMWKDCPKEGRLADCPLVEIPPHGRLIDADFEERHYTSMTVNPTPDVTKQDNRNSLIIIAALQKAKTIIEEEGRDNG